MKSAYELAMERLEKKAPSVPLTEDQKAALAEVDSIAKAKSAEKEVFLQGEIAKEQARGNFGEIQSLQKQLAHETARIREEAEAKKEKIRTTTA